MSDDAELQEVVVRLRHAERDLKERVAARRRALSGAASPIGDPLYQRLALVLAGLSARRAEAERALCASGRISIAKGATVMETPADRVERALDAALILTFPASDPIAIRSPEAESAQVGAADPRADETRRPAAPARRAAKRGAAGGRAT